jgi:hypothetical protein
LNGFPPRFGRKRVVWLHCRVTNKAHLPGPPLGLRVSRSRPAVIGFNRELSVIGEGDDPLLYLERQAYLGAIRQAVSGLEAERVTLAKARQRLRNARRSGTGQARAEVTC